MAIVNKKLNTAKHVGMILHVRGTFRMDTSMDEVLIWNPETKSSFVEYIMGDSWAEVDASDEIKAEYRQSIVNRQKECDFLNAESVLKSIRIGATVLVVRGRKVPKGKISVIQKIEDFGYGKVVFLDDGTYTYDRNVQVLYKNEFIEPELPMNYHFFFQAV
jgi:hypothetical protein